MKNSAQLYFLAALAIGQSLAANISPPLFVRGSLLVGDSGSEVSGLGKRQGSVTFSCPAGAFDCGGDSGCCPIGSQCLPNSKCSGGCGAGSTQCFDSCCEAGYACQGRNQPCLKVDSNTISVPAGVSTTSQTPVPGTTLLSSPTTAIPTTTKAASSSTTKATSSGTTLGNTYTTTPIKSTSSITYPVPTPPSTTLSGYPNSTVSAKGNSSNIAIIPVGSGSSLKPGAWLGALGAVLFFAFFHM